MYRERGSQVKWRLEAMRRQPDGVKGSIEFLAQVNVVSVQWVEDFGGTAGRANYPRQQRFDDLFPQQEIRTHRPHSAGVTHIAAGWVFPPHQLLAPQLGQIIRRLADRIPFGPPTGARSHGLGQFRQANPPPVAWPTPPRRPPRVGCGLYSNQCPPIAGCRACSVGPTAQRRLRPGSSHAPPGPCSKTSPASRSSAPARPAVSPAPCRSAVPWRYAPPLPPATPARPCRRS